MTHPTDDEIMELAGAWFHTGENQKRDDGYYYRSLGTPSNVRGSDLIEFARALLAEQARPTQVMQEARETLLIAAENFEGVAPSARDRCIRAANALHEVYTAQPLKAEQAKDAAEDAPSDQVIELAGALEVRRILEAIKEVANLRPANDKIIFDAAWQLCCEEIFYRATGCRWHMDEDAERFSRAARAAEGKA